RRGRVPDRRGSPDARQRRPSPRRDRRTRATQTGVLLMSTVFGTLSTDLKTPLAAALTAATWYEGAPPDVLPPPTAAVGYVWVDESERLDSDHLLQQVQAFVRY